MDVLLSQVTKTPGGYLWWHSLPAKGRQSKPVLTKKWAILLVSLLFPPSLRIAMLHAALSAQGTPQPHSMALYNWLVANVYHGKAELLYKEWAQLPKQVRIAQ